MLTALYKRVKEDEIKMAAGDMVESDIVTFMAPRQSGWLAKKGEGRLGVASWKKHWFILADHCLYYFLDPQDPNPRCIITLENCKVLQGNDRAKVTLVLKSATEGDFVKSVKPLKGGMEQGKHDQFLLRAESTKVRDKWLKCLKDELQNDDSYNKIQKKKRESIVGGARPGKARRPSTMEARESGGAREPMGGGEGTKNAAGTKIEAQATHVSAAGITAGAGAGEGTHARRMSSLPASLLSLSRGNSDDGGVEGGGAASGSGSDDAGVVSPHSAGVVSPHSMDGSVSSDAMSTPRGSTRSAPSSPTTPQLINVTVAGEPAGAVVGDAGVVGSTGTGNVTGSTSTGLLLPITPPITPVMREGGSGSVHGGAAVVGDLLTMTPPSSPAPMANVAGGGAGIAAASTGAIAAASTGAIDDLLSMSPPTSPDLADTRTANVPTANVEAAAEGVAASTPSATGDLLGMSCALGSITEEPLYATVANSVGLAGGAAVMEEYFAAGTTTATQVAGKEAAKPGAVIAEAPGGSADAEAGGAAGEAANSPTAPVFRPLTEIQPQHGATLRYREESSSGDGFVELCILGCGHGVNQSHALWQYQFVNNAQPAQGDGSLRSGWWAEGSWELVSGNASAPQSQRRLHCTVTVDSRAATAQHNSPSGGVMRAGHKFWLEIDLPGRCVKQATPHLTFVNGRLSQVAQ
jgi:hypothetical protein